MEKADPPRPTRSRNWPSKKSTSSPNSLLEALREVAPVGPGSRDVAIYFLWRRLVKRLEDAPIEASAKAGVMITVVAVVFFLGILKFVTGIVDRRDFGRAGGGFRLVRRRTLVRVVDQREAAVLAADSASEAVGGRGRVRGRPPSVFDLSTFLVLLETARSSWT